MDPVDPLIFHQRIKLPYRYTAGPINEAFLKGLARGVILGTRCETCNRLFAPARVFCPVCFGRTEGLIEVPDYGRLEGWTAVERDGIPVTFGLVRLEGADSLFFHRISATEELRHGMRVRARWRTDRSADIRDIEAFVPA